jgi:hypothetical protein
MLSKAKQLATFANRFLAALGVEAFTILASE